MSEEPLSQEIKTLDQLYINYTNMIDDKTKAMNFKSWSKIYDLCKEPKEYEIKIQKLINETNKKSILKNLEDKIKIDENNGSISDKKLIEDILNYCGISSEVLRKDALAHWIAFIRYVNKNSGEDYNKARSKLRFVVGVDYRYLDSYTDSLEAWNIIKKENNRIYFLGVPKDAKI